MSWVVFAIGLLAICTVVFIISRLWIGLVDAIIEGVKKAFGVGKKDSTDNWHTIDEIRDKEQ
ncbi:MAG: hypothetical protein PUK21_00745 [Peptostreptococcaceae bacterium]|nr:hypothetical protein [Peptostreptococcaceae bacterium]MDY5738779.1 hypothetical protein [Anaerovoracaceae bacterium]